MLAKINGHGNSAGYGLKQPKSNGAERVPSEPTAGSAEAAPSEQVGDWSSEAGGLNVGQGSGWTHVHAPDGAGPANDTAGLDDAGLFNSIEYLLTGPYSAFFREYAHAKNVSCALTLSTRS